MSVLPDLAAALASGTVEVIDLTAPLSSSTPILQLPPQFGQTATFEFEQISHYDERGPAWYWNNFRTGEHTGTHFDAPCHWVTGKDGEDVAQSRRTGWSRPRRCSTSPRRPRRTRTSCSRWTHIQAWEREHGPLPGGRLAAVPHRLGRPVRRPGRLPERRRDRPAHAGHLGRVRAVARRGVAGHRPRGGDRRHRRRRRALVRPAVPLPLVPAGRRQVRPDPAAEPRRCCRRPARSSSSAPLPIVGGSGSPARVLALVER